MIISDSGNSHLKLFHFQGPHFPKIVDFKKAIYSEAIYLKSAAIMGYRDGVIYKYVGENEVKICVCHHKSTSHLQYDTYDNAYFISNKSKITMAVNVSLAGKPDFVHFHFLENVFTFKVLPKSVKERYMFVLTIEGILEIFLDHAHLYSLQLHLVDKEIVSDFDVIAGDPK